VGEDPLKTTMLLQAVRRLPIATAIPLSLSIVLTVVTLVKVFAPLLAHLHLDERQPLKKRRTREAVDLGQTDDKPWLHHLVDHVDFLLEDLHLQDEDSLSPKGTQGLLELGATLNRFLDTMIDILPSLGSCVGSMVGCTVRLYHVGTACLPFAPMQSCAGLLGKAIKTVLGSLREPIRSGNATTISFANYDDDLEEDVGDYFEDYNIDNDSEDFDYDGNSVDNNLDNDSEDFNYYGDAVDYGF